MFLFAMIHTRHSAAYTPKALQSFFATTTLAADDRFILIDNDNSFDIADAALYPRLELVKNSGELSFAQNGNLAIAEASKNNSDLLLLNNDIIFTQAWLEPLQTETPMLVSPVSNQNLQYACGAFKANTSMELSEYLGFEKELAQIVRDHKAQHHGFLPVISTPFFCIKIPWEIYSRVGLFDVSFGAAGAEDTDYCVRAYLHGYRLVLAGDSYLLHFWGKSTWLGPEIPEETKARNEKFLQRFDEKWGERVRALAVMHDTSSIRKNGAEEDYAQRGDFQALLREMLANDGIRYMEGAVPKV